MTEKVKRSSFRTFLNTGTVESPVWSLINTGVTSAKINYVPKTTEEQYIHQDTATLSIDSYAPTMPIEATAVSTDDVFAYLDTLRKSRAVLADAESEVINLWLYKGVADDVYLAEKQSVSLQIDDFGGDAGLSTKLNYTINYLGDPSIGLFNLTDLEFTPTSLLTRLSLLDISGLTLTPSFKANRIWYKTTTTDVTNDITAESDNEDAVIAIDVDGVSVASGDPATWATGLNVVTITSTDGLEVATYIVLVTKE